MFKQPWKKYLPAINILMKRSSKEPQKLSMDHTDFERAAAGRKIKFSFSGLKISNGRIEYNAKHAPLAMDLVLLLHENEQTKKQLAAQEFEFTMTNEFQLIIKNNTSSNEPKVKSETEEPDHAANKEETSAG